MGLSEQCQYALALAAFLGDEFSKRIVITNNTKITIMIPYDSYWSQEVSYLDCGGDCVRVSAECGDMARFDYADPELFTKVAEFLA